MMRSRAIRVACLACLWASLGHAGSANLDVVFVSASGRGGKATYDSRIPSNVREKIKRSALAYARYDLAGRQSRTIAYGSEVSFRMPNNESLSLKPSANASRTHPVRLDVRVLSAGGKSLMKTQMRVRYGSPFLLHRPPLLIAVTANMGR